MLSTKPAEESDGWGQFPAPTPDPNGWCNETCVSSEALAIVARSFGLSIDSRDNWTRTEVHQKLMQGHTVLALIRVDLSTHQFGHYVLIRGLVDQGATVVFNDSYPNGNDSTWDMTTEGRRGLGEARREPWTNFDRSWASSVDEKDPMGGPGFQGHVRWAMSVQ
jgi:hypothetical protein